MHVPIMLLSECREFPSAPCLAGEKNLMTARVAMLLKSRASRDRLLFSLCNKKRLAIRHMNRPHFPMTIDSILGHQEVGRAKDLSAPPFIRCIQASCCNMVIIARISLYCGNCPTPQKLAVHSCS